MWTGARESPGAGLSQEHAEAMRRAIEASETRVRVASICLAAWSRGHDSRSLGLDAYRQRCLHERVGPRVGHNIHGQLYTLIFWLCALCHPK